jgi:hypothetical protein
MATPITIPRHRQAWVNFQPAEPYPCPICGHRLVVRPCPACLAAGLKIHSLTQATVPEPDEVEDLYVKLEPDAAARAEDIRAGRVRVSRHGVSNGDGLTSTEGG